MRYILLGLSLYFVGLSECPGGPASSTVPTPPPVVIKDNPYPYVFGYFSVDSDYFPDPERNLQEVASMANLNYQPGSVNRSEVDTRNRTVTFNIPNIGTEKNSSKFTIDACQAEKIVSESNINARFLLFRKAQGGQASIQKRLKKQYQGSDSKLVLVDRMSTDKEINLDEFTEREQLNNFKNYAQLFCDMKKTTGKVDNSGELCLEQGDGAVGINYKHLKSIKKLCAEGSREKPKYVRGSEIGLLKMWQEALPDKPTDIRPHISFKIYRKGFLNTVREDVVRKNTKDYNIDILTEEYETEKKSGGITTKEKNTRYILQSFLKLKTPGAGIALKIGAITKTEVRCELTDILAVQICILLDRANTNPDESLDVDVETNDSAKKQYKMSLKYKKPEGEDTGGLYVDKISEITPAKAK